MSTWGDVLRKVTKILFRLWGLGNLCRLGRPARDPPRLPTAALEAVRVGTKGPSLPKRLRQVGVGWWVGGILEKLG